MPASVTPTYLLEGAAYALEQCGLLLRDANLLYRNGSYASAVALSLFAREELGRYTILLRLRKKALAENHLTVKDIQKRCDDHVDKQKAGLLSIITTTKRESLANLKQGKSGSEEWKAAVTELITKLHNKKAKRLPSERHEQRVNALYVDAVSGGWNRPKNISQTLALKCFWEAVGDYSSAYLHYTNNNPTALELPRPETLAAGIEPPWPLKA